MLNEYYKTLNFIFSRFGVLIVFILGPFTYILILGGVYYAGRTQEVPTVILDMDKTALSREYIHMLDQSGNINLVESVSSMPELVSNFENNKVYFGVVIPKGFQKDVKSQKQTNIMVYGDGVNLVPAIIGYKGIRTVSATFSTGIKISIIKSGGFSSQIAHKKAGYISADLLAIYNTAYNYNTFILPSLICVVIMQIIFVGICAVSFTRNDERYKPSPGVKLHDWFFGEFLAYSTIMIPVSIIAFLFSQALFMFPIRGNLLEYLCITVLFVSTIVFLGIFLVTAFKDTIGILICLMYISVPLFMLSGGTWPQEAMPRFVSDLTFISPLTLYATVTRRLLTVGSDIYYSKIYILGIIIWLLFAFVISYLSAKRYFIREQI